MAARFLAHSRVVHAPAATGSLYAPTCTHVDSADAESREEVGDQVPSIARDVMRLLPQLARAKVYLLRDRVTMDVGWI